MGAAAEPFGDVPEVILEEIVLQLPSPASLVRASLVSKHWGRIISSSDFLARYRKLHPSSPLLGIFFSDRPFGLPAFRQKASIRSDPDLKAVQRRGDLHLLDLEEDSGWRIRDSRNGHLLLCRRAGESGGDSFSIYNPLSCRLVTIPEDRPHHQVGYFADCLLPGDGDSFRVVSVQQHRGRIRAVEYDPGARQWRSHQWESPWALDRPNKLKPSCLEPMHAGAGLIFWHYDAALALVLDCSSMQFSMCHVPGSHYAIGEIKDGVGCIVCLDDLLNPTTHGVLKVGLLNTGGETITWEFSREQQIPVTKLLGPDTRVRQVVLVTNGLALISFDDQYDQFVIDLNKLSLLAEFDFHGRAYAYQMAWPPVGLPSLHHICNEAQPVQLVLPVEPAEPLHDADVAAPIDDAGLAAPLDDVDLAAHVDDVAYTEGPPAVVLRPLDVCGIEHAMAAEADNLVGTVQDGTHLMETKAADTAAPSADLVEGMPHSSEAISRKPRCEEVLQSVGDVPPEQKDQGPIIPSDFDVNADVLELVELGEAHVQLAIDFYSSTVKDVVVERPTSSVSLEATFEEEAQPVQLVLPVESAPPLHDVGVAALIDDVGLAAPLDDVGLAALIDDGAYTEGPLDVVLRPLDVCSTESVMAAEADNLVRIVKNGMRLMETKAADTAAPSADLVEGKPHSNEAISRKPRCEGFVSSFRVDPPLLPAPCFPPMSPASKNHSPAQFFDKATYTKNVKTEAMYTQKVKNSEDLALDAHPSEQELIESCLRPHVISGEKSCWFIHEGMRARGGCRKARTVDSGKGFWHSEHRPKAVYSPDPRVTHRDPATATATTSRSSSTTPRESVDQTGASEPEVRRGTRVRRPNARYL